MKLARKPLFGLIALSAALAMPVAFAQEADATAQDPQDPTTTTQDPTAAPRLEALMRAAHSLKGAARIVGIDPVVQVADMFLRDALYIRALTRAVAPQAQQLVDLADRETQVPGTPDEAQHMNIGRRIVAIPRVPPLGLRDKSRGLVIADHLG